MAILIGSNNDGHDDYDGISLVENLENFKHFDGKSKVKKMPRTKGGVSSTKFLHRVKDPTKVTKVTKYDLGIDEGYEVRCTT